MSEFRKEMIKGTIQEIRGPRFGSDEIISYDPWDEYLIGTLIPVDWKTRSERFKNDDSEGNYSIQEVSSTTSPDNEIIDETDYVGSEDAASSAIVNNLSSNSILNPNSQIRTFGISFSIEAENPQIDICTSWARYFKNNDVSEGYNLKGEIVQKENGSSQEDNFEESEEEDFISYLLSKDRNVEEETAEEEVEDEKPSFFWQRKSYGYIKSFVIDKEFEKGKTITLENTGDGSIELFIRRYPIENQKYNISIYLINNLIPDYKNNNFHAETEECLFQPSIRVNLDKKYKLGMKTLMEGNSELDFIYRNKQVLATGHLTSVIWEDIDYANEFDKDLLWPDGDILSRNDKDFEDFFEPTIRSEFVPLYPINLPNFNLNGLDLVLEAKVLANSTQDEICSNLMHLVDAYSEWIENNKKEVEKLKKEGELSSADLDIIFGKKDSIGLLTKQEKARDRIKEGIDLIKNEKLVYLSFCFANKTISLQNEWDQKYRDADKDFEWRPFQLAFILMNLESIFNDNSENKDVLDLLWIPTGGGKTEAYLGIMAYTMALRRLKSRFGLSDEKTGAGVSIISRYTLRLLTVQQFRRTLKMVTAAEFLRVWTENGITGWRPKNCSLSDDWLYGSVRFSVGMWVGGAVTPLHLSKVVGRNDVGAMGILKAGTEKMEDALGNPAQIIKCPVCGSWLSVPEDGLTDNKNMVHVLVEIESKEVLEKALDEILKLDPDISYTVSDKNTKKNIFTISLIFNKSFSQGSFLALMENIESVIDEGYDIKFLSLNKIHPGYLSSRGRIGRTRLVEETDFEIWCTNPECESNSFWKEGSPKSDNKFQFPDGNYERGLESPFIKNLKIPIPAYLIDEHVYYRCPTVLVCTADKIARLSFVPKAGTIFGNVDKFNKYYGYFREGTLPEYCSEAAFRDENNVVLSGLKAPDLIIQDELHLMDGPLGSLFGLYESIVSFLIEKNGGNPKYIASTATINNAQKQVNLLFAKDVLQFPPYGLDISDSYFVKDNKEMDWNEKNKGRVYLGIYAPGLGHFTHQVRIYSRLLKVGQKNYNEDDSREKNSKYYWTLVGYYNAIRELGSAVALYKDDIIARLNQISIEDDIRSLNPEDDKVELSSRIDSTKLPLILDKLERDGSTPEHPVYNAIFTTSMFGTGVDISHLSTMMVNSQPKTTGSYIQATGRVGRSYGGFIIDLLRSGRPRDLNHYEMFSSYHSRIYREVEPVSVSPFSKGCLSKGLGPSLVAFLRNSKGLNCDWVKEDGKTILEDDAYKDIELFSSLLKKRLTKCNIGKEEDVLKFVEEGVKKWIKVAEETEELYYYENKFKNLPIKRNIVLGDPEHEKSDGLETVFKNAPQSLREIEDTLGFWV